MSVGQGAGLWGAGRGALSAALRWRSPALLLSAGHPAEPGSGPLLESPDAVVTAHRARFGWAEWRAGA